VDQDAVEPDEPSIHEAKVTQRESSSIFTPGVGIAIVASIAVLFLLYWARSVLIPIALAVFLRYALMPVVAWLRVKARIPGPIGAALVLVLIIVGVIFSTVALEDQAVDLLDKLPAAAQKFERAIRNSAKDAEGTLNKITKAATEIDKAASTAAEPVGRAANSEAHASNLPSLRSYLWAGSFSVATAGAQSVVVLALAYFLLIAGDDFRRKIVRISGNTLASKKITVHILQQIDQQIQRYLFVQLGASVVNCIATWIALASIGLENAAFWGLVAGVLHLIPYVGPTTVIVLTTIVAYLQFPTLTPVVLVCSVQLAIAGIIGFGLVPWLTGKLSRLNAVTVFVALLLWGWLWGIWGLLLGVPIVMAFQAICERIPELHDIADLLGPGPAVIASPASRSEAPLV
jgi:predicted PurR-regulated permease PerM